MSFLVWWNPTTWFSDVGDKVFGSVQGAIRILFYEIASLIYKCVILVYRLFEALCHGRLLDSELINTISARVGTILGIIMFFYVVLSFVQYLVDPDQITDKTRGAAGLIKRVLVTIVMIGVAPFVFNVLYQLQVAVIDSNVISKMVLPYEPDTDKLNKFGEVLAAELFTSFYRVDSKFYDGEEIAEGVDSQVKVCENSIFVLKQRIYDYWDFNIGRMCLNEATVVTSVNDETRNEEQAIIDFNWLFLIASGIALVYFLLSYAIKVGVRIVKLALLEIISPAAFVAYLSPNKENLFTRWLQTYAYCYIEVFVRIAVINFSVFLIATIFDNQGSWVFWQTINPANESTRAVIGVTMIIAILTFAKQVPDLIQKLLPGGKLDLGGWNPSKDMLGGKVAVGATKATLRTGAAVATGAAVGLVGGGINSAIGAYQTDKSTLGSGIGGAVGGLVSGAFHGIDNGVKAKSLFGGVSSSYREQRMRNWRKRDAIASGSTFGGRFTASMQHAFGLETAGQKDEREISILDNYSKNLETIEGYADSEITEVRNLKRNFEFIQQSGRMTKSDGTVETDAEFSSRLGNARKAWKDAQHQAITDILQNNRSSSVLDFTADDNGIQDIRNHINYMNHQYEQNANLFANAHVTQLNNTSTYDTIDSNSGNARTASRRIRTDNAYDINKANDEYAWWEVSEKSGRISRGSRGPGSRKP